MRICRILQISAIVSVISVALVVAIIGTVQCTDAAHAATTMNLNVAVHSIGEAVITSDARGKPLMDVLNIVDKEDRRCMTTSPSCRSGR